MLPTPPNPLPPYPQHPFASPFNPRPNLRLARCQLCGLNNHRAPECFHRFNHAYQGHLLPPHVAAMMAPTHSYQDPRNATASFTPEDQLDASSSLWYLDSGATNHVTSDLNHLNIHSPYTGSNIVTIGNGEGLHIQNTGSSLAKLPLSNSSIKLSHILHVPQITQNLLSANRFITDNNCAIILIPYSCAIKDL